MLLLLLLLHNAIASDYKNDGNYTIKVISSCPAEGYFFHQVTRLNEVEPSPCYLCFCKGDGFAVCWHRSKSQCDAKNHKSVARDRRSRRSSSILTDFPVEKTAGRFFRNQPPYACKPVGLSLSKGCPPDDWCLGCTLCDCDVSGLWRCHKLSFCSEKKATKIIENHNDTLKKLPVKISPKPSINANTPRAHRYIKKLHASHKCNNKSVKCTPDHGCSVASQEFGVRRHDDTVLMIQRDLIGRTPMKVQGVRVKKVIGDNTGNIKLVHKIVQRAMAAVHKIINKNERNSTNVTKLFKVVQKRSMSLGDGQTSHQAEYMSPHVYKKPSPRKLRKQISLNNIKVPNSSNRNSRMRRDISYRGNKTQKLVPTAFNNTSLNEISFNESSKTKSIKINKDEYFRYNVFTDKKLNSKEHNQSEKVEVITNSDNSRTSTLTSNTMGNQKHGVGINPNTENKTRLYSNIRQTKNDLSKLFLRKYNSLKENQKKKQSDNEFINLLDVILNRKECLHHNLLKKTNVHNNIAKKYNIITYLRELLNKIFKSSQNGGSLGDDVNLKLLRKQNFIDIFCDKNLSCKVRPEDEIKLQINIIDFNGELYKILEIIKIIKTVLIDIELAHKKQQVNEKKSQSRNTAHFKSTVLNEKKTEDRKQLLLYYLQDSFNAFLKCMEKFSYILYDILSILTGKDISKKTIYRSLHNTKPNALSKSNLKFVKRGKKIETLKSIILNYNILQNKFIKIIYDMLIKLESNNSNNEKMKKLSLGKDIKRAINSNNAMEIYSKNIVENLRKLKKLSQKLSTKQRKKRSTMKDDDAVEYLLMLMEYLLKQNYPLDAAPVNDGIDLLIDAIKHAPDIKPIKKKVLDNPTTRTPATRTTPGVTAVTFSYVDNIYGIDSLEKGFNDTSHSEDNQVIFSPVIDGDEKVDDYQSQLHDSKKMANKYQFSNVNSIVKNDPFASIIKTTTPFITTTPLIRYDFFKENAARLSNTEKPYKTYNNFDIFDKDNSVENLKFENNEIDHNKPYEIEEFSPSNLLTPVTDGSSVTLPSRTSAVLMSTTRKFHHMTKDKFEKPDPLTYKRKKTKSRFGWIDYDQEENVSKLVQRGSAMKTVMTTNTPKPQTDMNDISSITKEIMDDMDNKRFEKLIPSAIFHKLNLLNSKEYDMKKSEIDSESKEIEQEDTYVNDIFPSYLT